MADEEKGLLSAEETEKLELEKAQKSRNRVFALLVFVSILLLAALVYEIAMLLMPNQKAIKLAFYFTIN